MNIATSVKCTILLRHMSFFWKKKIMQSTYDFSEELPFSDGVDGRQKLLSKLCELGRGNFATIFTSEPWVLTVGCFNGRPFLIDTHPVTARPGTGSGLVIVGREKSPEVWILLCCWLWKRLFNGRC